MPKAAQPEAVERRARQRFVAACRGESRFWVIVEGERLPLVDLSMESFSMPASTPPASHRCFSFVLQWAGGPDEVCGTARIVNYLGAPAGGQVGCVFESLDDDGRARLEGWLAAHVIENSALRMTGDDARTVVRGPSLV